MFDNGNGVKYEFIKRQYEATGQDYWELNINSKKKYLFDYVNDITARIHNSKVLIDISDQDDIRMRHEDLKQDQVYDWNFTPPSARATIKILYSITQYKFYENIHDEGARDRVVIKLYKEKDFPVEEVIKKPIWINYLNRKFTIFDTERTGFFVSVDLNSVCGSRSCKYYDIKDRIKPKDIEVIKDIAIDIVLKRSESIYFIFDIGEDSVSLDKHIANPEVLFESSSPKSCLTAISKKHIKGKFAPHMKMIDRDIINQNPNIAISIVIENFSPSRYLIVEKASDLRFAINNISVLDDETIALLAEQKVDKSAINFFSVFKFFGRKEVLSSLKSHSVTAFIDLGYPRKNDAVYLLKKENLPLVIRDIEDIYTPDEIKEFKKSISYLYYDRILLEDTIIDFEKEIGAYILVLDGIPSKCIFKYKRL